MYFDAIGNLLKSIFIMGFIIGLFFWATYEIVDYVFLEDVIVTKKPIQPTVKIISVNGISDTLYIYKKP